MLRSLIGRKTWVVAVGATVVVVVGSLFWINPVMMAGLDARVTDLITGWVGGGALSGRVTIIEIDEKSVAQFGRWPWPRDRLGLLVQRTLENGAATVVLDAMFPEEDRREASGGGTNDAALATALSGRPTVIGYDFNFAEAPRGASGCEMASLPLVIVNPDPEAFFHPSSVVCSVRELSQSAAAAGFLNSAADRDGRLRGLPVVMEWEGRYYPSLALAAVNLYRHTRTIRLVANSRGAAELILDRQTIPLEDRSWMRLHFRGPRRTFPLLSAADLMAQREPVGQLQGKIAVIGSTASGLEDTLGTPVGALFPGVEVQATAIDNLLQGDPWSKPDNAPLWEMAILFAGGLASTMSLALFRSFWGALTTLALIAAAWAGAVLLLSTTGILLSPLPVTAAIACNYSVLMLVNYMREKGRADRTERQLISAHEFTETVLAASEQRYQRLVENINDAIIMNNVQGRLLFANRKFREWFGFKDRDIGKVALEDWVAPEWRSALRDLHNRRVRREPSPDHFEYEGLRPDGTRIWIEALVTTVEAEGHITGTQSALRDITERKRIEEQYLQAQKMESIGRLAGGVAHDFNNLLTVINGYSAMLLSKLPESDPSREHVKEINEAGERAAALTQKLLAFSRKQVTHPEPLNLNLVVADAEKMFLRLIGEDIELCTRLSPATGRVMCDRGQLHQVLMNLVVNSRDAMPDGGKLTIETKNVDVDESSSPEHPGVAPGSYVYLGVADTGVGMSAEVQRHMFEPFFTTKDVGKGTGLGLATVYGIVNQNSGCIRVESEPGRGATFHIYLPLTNATATDEADAGSLEDSLDGWETVLLVEDQDAVRQLAGAVLERYGYHVLRASSGAEAIKLAAEYAGTIHLLLADVVLPRMNGRALADTLRNVRPTMKVLYTSGYSEEIIAHQGVIAHGVSYIPKPFTPDVLAAKVRETLAHD